MHISLVLQPDFSSSLALPGDSFEQLGYSFISGGAMGNGIDRFVTGYVVDFLDFRLINFPTFNLADFFINIGIFPLPVPSSLY